MVVVRAARVVRGCVGSCDSCEVVPGSCEVVRVVRIAMLVLRVVLVVCVHEDVPIVVGRPVGRVGRAGDVSRAGRMSCHWLCLDRGLVGNGGVPRGTPLAWNIPD